MFRFGPRWCRCALHREPSQDMAIPDLDWFPNYPLGGRARQLPGSNKVGPVSAEIVHSPEQVPECCFTDLPVLVLLTLHDSDLPGLLRQNIDAVIPLHARHPD